MDYVKASKQQLINICNDNSARMRDRYSAAQELQKRQKGGELIGNKVQISRVFPSRRDNMGDG